MTDDTHALPVADLVDHDETRDCWCQPRVLQVCGECDGDEDGCWFCEDGMVEASDPTMEALVVHNAVDGRP